MSLKLGIIDDETCSKLYTLNNAIFCFDNGGTLYKIYR